MRSLRLGQARARVWRQELTAARGRVRGSFWAALQAALAAAIAWQVTHRLLGHPQPFFAPIAAAIAMSTSYYGRSRRPIQMIVGVLLGIGVAELLAAALGTSAVVLGGTVLVTMLAALALGGGFVGEGRMFVNQAAASAILVLRLRRHETGAERGIDALVGGGTALVVGVILFPSAPLPRLWAAERALLQSLAAALERLAQLLEQGQPGEPDWGLSASHEIHEKLSRLAEARARARWNVRTAPRRWRQRSLVAAEDRRIARFDLLSNAVLSLVRATHPEFQERELLPDCIRGEIGWLAAALRKLAETPQPWPPRLVEEVQAGARRVIANAPASSVNRVPMVSAILSATAQDLAGIAHRGALGDKGAVQGIRPVA